MKALNRSYTVYLVAGLMSLCLSALIDFRVDVINPDAICYLMSAEAMKDGLHAGMHLCGQATWPFYSLLIYLFSKLTTINVTVSAYVLNAGFTLLSVLSFIAIIQFLSQQSRLMWLGAAVILFAHEFNSVRDNIIRDHGFWAFYLLSILFLLKFFRYHQIRFALAWSISLIAATLFRVEGAVFLAILPFLALLEFKESFVARIKHFIQLNSLTILAAISVLIFVQDYSRLHELQFQAQQGWAVMASHFTASSEIIAKSVLGVFGARDANVVFGLTLVSWFMLQVIGNVTVLYALLVVYAWWKRAAEWTDFSRVILWAYVIINAVITFSFLLQNWFLAKRYLMALSLTLMLWIPYALIKQKKWVLNVLLTVIVLSSFINVLNISHSKAYIREAGNWLSENAPKTASIYSNDYQLMYYSKHFGDNIFPKSSSFIGLENLKKQDLTQYDYLAVRLNSKDKDAIDWVHSKIPLVPIKVFANAHGDHIVIYQVLHRKG